MKTPTVKDVQKNKAILKIVDFFSNTYHQPNQATKAL